MQFCRLIRGSKITGKCLKKTKQDIAKDLETCVDGQTERQILATATHEECIMHIPRMVDM
jgi:hypothetical protein